MLRLTPVVIAVSVALLACGCSAQAARDPAAAIAVPQVSAPVAARLAHLAGTRWHFIKVAGMPVPSKVAATLRFRGGHASGRAGCNSYGAAYHVAADGTARFKQTLSTEMACLQPKGAMQVEHRIFAAFRRTVKMAMQGDDLVLLDAAGKPLATLQQQAP